ncbi:hypothetical protein TVAG_282060 [Trichomonas vaginalis G3]|uniref:Uncharacterized protein n=1 Tax=Trichomonas vaginalis (strain ATCC PRA-98 / G3) TaxID=412133 RepID=A2E9S1_TRIV3|nr:hypothetical protein TVAGG3_0043420 [Trichomonas vaginalis G3]EAY10606.1 hypothetical protein TVAG_282060 [Trichomonas vaginalis G3]KAI5540858.1 hypothetical protein TVAGG3_0043420 [Trichomonas vaginalis G3]|eukprot:XP_001322829.1 hypothetical protein [Trichomonas vaginalis G3]
MNLTYSDDFESDDSSNDPIFTPSVKQMTKPIDTPKSNKENKPDNNEIYGVLSFQKMNNIIKQREEYLKWQQAENTRIWGENFSPYSSLDKIANRIALMQVKEVTDLLGKTCDDFIESLVHTEFFPENNQ